MNFVEIFELVGVVAFAMSGVLVGIEYGFDVFGIFILAFLTALGGGLFRDMMFGLSIIGRRRSLEKMNKDTPVYFMSGDKDPVGGNGMQVAKVYSLFIRAGMRDVFYKFYKEGRHEMLNELNRDEVYRDILNWLFKKID